MRGWRKGGIRGHKGKGRRVFPKHDCWSDTFPPFLPRASRLPQAIPLFQRTPLHQRILTASRRRQNTAYTNPFSKSHKALIGSKSKGIKRMIGSLHYSTFFHKGRRHYQKTPPRPPGSRSEYLVNTHTHTHSMTSTQQYRINHYQSNTTDISTSTLSSPRASQSFYDPFRLHHLHHPHQQQQQQQQQRPSNRTTQKRRPEPLKLPTSQKRKESIISPTAAPITLTVISTSSEEPEEEEEEEGQYYTFQFFLDCRHP